MDPDLSVGVPAPRAPGLREPDPSESSSDSKTVEDLDLCDVGARASAKPENKTGKRKSKTRTVRWRRVPEDWSPDLDHVRIARETGVDLALELAKFRDHEFARARTDADATFRNWLRNARPGAMSTRAPNRAEDQLQAQLARVKELEAEEARERVGA